MRDFEFLEPATVAEASRMLADLGDNCRIFAGGTALMLGMRQRMLTPSHLVSLGRLDALRGISFDAREGLRIGALTLHAEVARSPLVQAHYPMLASMAARVANPQVRNQGTLGGNLCYADPATDPPGCLMALGAQIVVSGGNGERVIDIEDFLVDYYVTALAPDEVVTQIRLPAPDAGADGRYARFLRTAAEHRPLASVALAVRREGTFCVEARLAVGVRPRRSRPACAAPKRCSPARPSPRTWPRKRPPSSPRTSTQSRTCAGPKATGAKWCGSSRAAPSPSCSARHRSKESS